MNTLRIAAASIAVLLLTIASADARPKHHRHYALHIMYGEESVVGHRPSGCPHRFCGCEASLYLFGKIIPDLNLASNWKRRFPHVAPAPRMAAARDGHVMVLISHVSGANWLVHDGNSGGGKTREHVRSISGYTIVDPNGNRVRHAGQVAIN